VRFVEGSIVPQNVDPSRLTLALEGMGWNLVGGRRHQYNRLAPPNDPSGRTSSLVIPLDSTAPEFNELMLDAFQQLDLQEGAGEWRRRLFPILAIQETDEFRFRRESDLPAGLIKWRDGEGLIHSARATLVAGAKATLSKMRHFGNRYGQFANRYLDSVLMGQTAPGSYVVTAYVSSQEEIAIRQGGETLGIPGIDYMEGREVTRSVAEALGAASEALEHFRNTSSMNGFEASVSNGFSYELANALAGLTEHAAEADISVEWSPSQDRPNLTRETFSFSSEDAEVFQKAASRLVTTAVEPRRTIIGRVHLLTKKEAGLPGVIGVESTSATKPRKVRVHLLEASDYHLAVRAHDEDLMIRVVGDLQREGNLNWLYSARLEAIVGPIDDTSYASLVQTEPLDLPFDSEIPIKRRTDATDESA
jgi:hypothetical protein